MVFIVIFFKLIFFTFEHLILIIGGNTIHQALLYNETTLQKKS